MMLPQTLEKDIPTGHPSSTGMMHPGKVFTFFTSAMSQGF